MKTSPTRSMLSRPPGRFSVAESAFLSAAIEEGIRIQPRFRHEPLLAGTGRGYMAPAGVAEIARLKKRAPSRPPISPARH